MVTTQLELDYTSRTRRYRYITTSLYITESHTVDEEGLLAQIPTTNNTCTPPLGQPSQPTANISPQSFIWAGRSVPTPEPSFTGVGKTRQ